MSTFDQFLTGQDVNLARLEARAAPGSSRLWRWGTIAALIFFAVIMLLPFFWLVSSSLKTQTEIFAYPPQWIPNPIQWQNYTDALSIRPFGLYLRNSLTRSPRQYSLGVGDPPESGAVFDGEVFERPAWRGGATHGRVSMTRVVKE